MTDLRTAMVMAAPLPLLDVLLRDGGIAQIRCLAAEDETALRALNEPVICPPDLPTRALTRPTARAR